MTSSIRRAVAGAIVLIALGVGSTSAAAGAANRYPPAFERAFIASCNATSGGMAGMCRCALRWIERHYTYRQVVAIYLHDQPRMRKIMLRAVLACTR
jgi:hypothetical protein